LIYSLFFKIAIVPILLVIAIQDFRFRRISWLLVLMLMFLLLVIGIGEIGYNKLFKLAGFNLLFFGLQMICLIVFFSLLNRKLINLTRNYLGLGDILLYASFCLAFSPVNFVLFYICTLIITLSIVILTAITGRKWNKEIPLAGYVSICGILVILVNSWVLNQSLYKDVFDVISLK